MASSFDMEQQGFHEAFSGGNNGENNCITSVRNVSLVNNIDESCKKRLDDLFGYSRMPAW